jgi:hypothetical protein
LLVLLLLALAQTVFAQGVTPPDTAQHGLDWLVILLAALPGLIGTMLLDELKKLPFLADHPGESQIIRDGVVKILAAVLPIGSAYLVIYATPIATYLDSSGLWTFILTAWPWAQGWFLLSKAARTKTTVTYVPEYKSQ